MSEHKDGHSPGHGHDSPLTALWVAMTGASAGDHHEIPPGLDPKSAGVGHEPDKFDVRSIVYVPIAVIIALILTYTIVQFGIGALTKDSTDTKNERVNINDRFGRFSSQDPKPITEEKNNLPIVAQPRLEHNRQVDSLRPGQDKADPEYLRSFTPKKAGNSPELYPQDLLPERFIDPKTGGRPLLEYSVVKEGKVAQIPVRDAMALVLGKLPLRKEAVTPATTSDAAAKQSNGGVGSTLPKAPAKEHQ